MSVIIETLRRSKARVAQGWCQNEGQDIKGNVCAGRAVYMGYQEAIGENLPVFVTIETQPEYHSSLTYLLKAGREQTGESWDSIPDWNDQKGRTKEEVLDAFDHAIKLAERDEGGDAA